ncbi:MAG: hypothetical protein RL722_308, partial [Pseudomonadota bacterium]
MKWQTAQRVMQLAWLALLAAAATALVLRGDPGDALWAGGLVAAGLLLHLPWLGLQFFLAAAAARRRVAAGDTSLPAPGRAAWWRAWWAEVGWCSRSYAWHQPWSGAAQLAQLPADPLAPGRTQGRGILFVHGFMCSGGFWGPWTRRLRALGRPYVCVSLSPALADLDSYAVQVEAEFRRLFQATGHAPVIVCHSMGGLVVRAWLRERSRQGARAGRLAAPLDIVGLACPHHGTEVARWGLGPSARQMQTGSAWLRELADFEAGQPERDRPHWVCLYSECDNMVYPPRSACLEGGREAW